MIRKLAYDWKLFAEDDNQSKLLGLDALGGVVVVEVELGFIETRVGRSGGCCWRRIWCGVVGDGEEDKSNVDDEEGVGAVVDGLGEEGVDLKVLWVQGKQCGLWLGEKKRLFSMMTGAPTSGRRGWWRVGLLFFRIKKKKRTWKRKNDTRVIFLMDKRRSSLKLFIFNSNQKSQILKKKQFFL